MIRRVLPALSALLLLMPVAAMAGSQVSQEVRQAESYLQKLDTVKARFVQTAHDGTQLVGTFYLDRPGKLRFEYDPPVKDFVVADGYLIYFYDGQLGEQTNAPIGQTLADFLLRKNLRLTGDVKVTKITRGGGLLQLTVQQATDPGAGSLTLGFTEKPFGLKKWRVKDSQGAITEVELFDILSDIKINSKLFIYRNPKKIRKLND